MSQWLFHWIRDRENVTDPAVRQRYGVLGSMVGILCNVLLFLAKLMIGAMTASIAITADAFNNLSDVGSAVITLMGFRLSSRPADQKHPFGYGRFEYIGGLAVAFIILLLGVELLRSSVDRILHPEAVAFSYGAVAVLVLSILVKWWMGVFNGAIGKKIGSAAMKATSLDSLCDVAATGATLLSLLLARFAGLVVDGYMGLVVAGFVFYAGIKIARDTISPLLGQQPDPTMVEQLKERILRGVGVVGVHDLVVHDYGPGRVLASAHVEVSAKGDLLACHDSIDMIEREIIGQMGVQITLHMDPIVLDDPEVNRLRQLVARAVTDLDPHMSVHDFRATVGPSHKNLIFDVVAPYSVHLTDRELSDRLNAAVQAQESNSFCVISVDRGYVG